MKSLEYLTEITALFSTCVLQRKAREFQIMIKNRADLTSYNGAFPLILSLELSNEFQSELNKANFSYCEQRRITNDRF